jgi:hypothetical protein
VKAIGVNGAGEGIRTLDPNLGKVSPTLCASLPAIFSVCENGTGKRFSS